MRVKEGLTQSQTLKVDRNKQNKENGKKYFSEKIYTKEK